MGIVIKDVEERLPIVEAPELTEFEWEIHDCLDRAAIEDGRDSASFVRYRGATYNLHDFSSDVGLLRNAIGMPEELQGWHAYLSDSFFSGVVIRYHEEDDEHDESVTCGTFYVS